MFKEIFLGEEKIFTLNVILSHIALILTSFAFICVFSHSTSFLYPFLGDNSAVFQAIGKCWLEGFLPYKDLFDHKGPLLFLIDAVGYAIYPRTGIMVPQIIFMYFTNLFIWRSLGIFFTNKWKIFFFLLTTIYYVSLYRSGNRPEEFNLPFIAFSAYCFLLMLKNYTNDGKIFSPKFYGFIYGLSFGASVLLRASNAMPICCFAFLTMIFLIQSGDFKNLWQNFLSFCAGFATIFLPFVIYFAAHGALYDMIYGTILFNVKYAMNASFHKDDLYYSLIFVALHFWPLFFMIIASTFKILINKKDKFAWSGLFSGIMLLIMLTRLRHHSHYSMIIVPMFPLLLVVLKSAFKDFVQWIKKIWRIPGISFKRTLCKLLLPIFILTMIFYAKFCFEYYLIPLANIFSPQIVEEELNYKKESATIQDLQKIIPEDERKSFVTWGLSGYICRWVLETDMKSRNRFLFNQKSFGMLDPNVRKEWFDGVTSDYPLWILYGGKLKEESPYIFIKLEDSEVENLLSKKYVFKGEIPFKFQTLKLYRLKE